MELDRRTFVKCGAVVGAAALSGGVLAACTSSGGGSSSGDSGSAAEEGNRSEITVALRVMPNGLDCLSEDTIENKSIVYNVYDRLVAFDESNNQKPGIAKSWDQVDELTWEFDIDLSYKFSNGDQLTMDDVVFSFERLKSIPKTADISAPLDSVSYQGEKLTLKIKEVDNSSIPSLLMWTIIINKKHVQESDDNVYLTPLGTGPYKVTEFTPGASATIEAWDEYPFTKPQIDVIKYINIAEDSTRYVALETGEIDFAAWLSSLEINTAQSNSNLTTMTVPSSNITTFICNLARKPFDDVNVRRGLAYAFDRKAFAEMQDFREPCKGPLFAGWDLYYESSKMPDYDIAKAKELLEGAGISPASPLNIDMYCPLGEAGLELYQSTLLGLGVNLNIIAPEFTVYLEHENSGDFDMLWTVNWNTGGTPLSDLERFDENFIGTRNASSYKGARAQEIIKEMRINMDEKVVKDLSVELIDIVSEDCPQYPCFYESQHAAMVKNLTGVGQSPDAIYLFRNAKLS